MAKDKKSFILYSDISPTVNLLTNEQAGILFKAILDFVNDEEVSIEDLSIRIAFEPIKQALKRDLKKYEARTEARREAGRLGGLAKAELAKQKKAKASKAKQEIANLPDNGNVNGNGNGNVNKKKSIEEREQIFRAEALTHLDNYDKSLIDEFNSYWTERGSRDRKMRFEKQTSFDTSRRLKKWKENQDKWEKENPKKKRTASKAWQDLISKS